MKINKTILFGILAGIITSTVLFATSDLSQVNAQMSMGGGMSHGSDSSSDSSHGGMGSGGPSMHGVFYAPGSTHQICGMGADMPPHYCEPYYKAMTSVKGVRVTNVDPINDNTLRVTLKDLTENGIGVDQQIGVVVGGGDLVGNSIVNGGWSDTVTVDVKLQGMGHIWNHDNMVVHIFPITNG